METKVEASVAEPLSVPGQGVTLRGVGRVYRSRRADTTALEGVHLKVAAGEVLGVVGPSGCGKSTLLELVAGLQEPDAGAIEVAGEAAPGNDAPPARSCPSATSCCRGATRWATPRWRWRARA